MTHGREKRLRLLLVPCLVFSLLSYTIWFVVRTGSGFPEVLYTVDTMVDRGPD